jgi:hypothetical protein
MSATAAAVTIIGIRSKTLPQGITADNWRNPSAPDAIASGI